MYRYHDNILYERDASIGQRRKEKVTTSEEDEDEERPAGIDCQLGQLGMCPFFFLLPQCSIAWAFLLFECQRATKLALAHPARDNASGCRLLALLGS